MPFSIYKLDRESLKIVKKYSFSKSIFGLPTVAVPVVMKFIWDHFILTELVSFNITKLMPKIFNFDTLKENIPKRDVNSHKGNFGKVLVGGSEGMGGAAILASETCLYCGSGLVHLYANSNAVKASLKRNPEIMAMCMSEKKLFPKQLNVILCGPGLSSDSLSKKMFLNAAITKILTV